jgi:hypothetical protein
MTIRHFALLALSIGLAASPAAAKPAHPVHHASPSRQRADVRYAQGLYDYRASAEVREEFRDGPRTDWRRQDRYSRREFHRGREGMVIENLRSSDFTGGVGYGLNGDVPGFVDGYGQTHFFVGNFRAMRPGAGFGVPRPGPRRF